MVAFQNFQKHSILYRTKKRPSSNPVFKLWLLKIQYFNDHNIYPASLNLGKGPDNLASLLTSRISFSFCSLRLAADL